MIYKNKSQRKASTKAKLELDLGTQIYYYQTDKAWTFTLDDDKQRQFGVLYEILDMREYDGEADADYPYLVSAGLIVHKPHASFYEGQSEFKPTLRDLRSDCNSYMGTVLIDHVLANATKNGSEGDGEAFELLARQFAINEAHIKTIKNTFGTVATQSKPGTEHKYLKFKTVEAAVKYIQLLAQRAPILSLIGFFLDRPINMVGETGWDQFKTMVYGPKYKREVGY
jgi:hypothetical protein